MAGDAVLPTSSFPEYKQQLVQQMLGGRGARLFELVTVGSARLITVVLTSRTKHNFQLIKEYSKYSAQKSPLFKRHADP